jgi:hypothetical protein
MVKSNKRSFVLILGVLLLFSIFIFLLLIINQKILRKECPLKWVEMQAENEVEYFVFSDVVLVKDEVDADWILSNCNISKDLVF